MPAKHLYFLLIIFYVATLSCSKSVPGTPAVTVPTDTTAPAAAALDYGDSVFFVKERADDYIVQPVKPAAGEYWGFPEGIEIDGATGAINVSKSETGLRYKIFFLPQGSTDTVTTVLLISGINYLDKIYNLAANDSIAFPVYNGDLAGPIPGFGEGSVFDEDGGCNRENVVIDPRNGTINLAESIRRGIFGETPKDGSAKEVEMLYRIDDGSNKSLNKLKVKLYFFDTPADITSDLVQLLEDRQGSVFRTAGEPSTGSAARTSKAAKPRPPCLFIVRRATR